MALRAEENETARSLHFGRTASFLDSKQDLEVGKSVLLWLQAGAKLGHGGFVIQKFESGTDCSTTGA
jgi:hypothetical protein